MGIKEQVSKYNIKRIIRANIKGKINTRFSDLAVNFDMSLY